MSLRSVYILIYFLIFCIHLTWLSTINMLSWYFHAVYRDQMDISDAGKESIEPYFILTIFKSWYKLWGRNVITSSSFQLLKSTFDLSQWITFGWGYNEVISECEELKNRKMWPSIKHGRVLRLNFMVIINTTLNRSLQTFFMFFLSINFTVIQKIKLILR